MPRSKLRTFTLTYPVRVRVTHARLEALASLKYIDTAELARAARAEIAVGFVKTDCCRHVVRAVVRKGMVTAIQIEPADKDKQTRITPEFRRLMNAARRRARGDRGWPDRLPVPVTTFLARAFDGSITIIQCIQICLFGWCIACCFNGDIAFCGKVTVDTTSGPYPEP